MHCRSKEHVSKPNSKSEKTRSESPSYKHLSNTHGGKDELKEFENYLVQILKVYNNPFTRLVEKGTFIISHRGKLLHSKSEWHQAKVVRTQTEVIQGSAKVIQGRQERGQKGGGQAGGGREGQGGGSGHTLGGREGGRTQEQ